MNKTTRMKEAEEFQDTILRSIQHHTGPYPVTILGLDYWMFESCFDPAYAKASLLLLQNQGVEKNDEVLVQFSGPGFDARYAYEQGSSHVVSVEKFEIPHLCAKYNTARNGLQEHIDNRLGDLFGPLEKNEKFDLILANPPFRSMQPKNTIEAAIRDTDYHTLDLFWKEVGNHLKPNGRVRAVFADVGDMEYFETLIEKNGFKGNIIAQNTYASDVRIHVYECKKK